MHRRQTATWEGGRTRSLSSQLPSTLRSPKYVDPAPSCKALRAAGLLCGQLLVSAMALARSTAVSQCILCISDASARARRSQATCGATQLLVHVLRLVAPTRPTIASRQAGSVLRIDSQLCGPAGTWCSSQADREHLSRLSRSGGGARLRP